MIRLLALLMRLLTWLPFPLLAACGRGLGRLLYVLGRERRRVTLINLGLCFPTLSAQEKSALAKRHFALFGRSFLERGLLWWSSPERIRRRVRLEGREHLDALKGKPVILLVPHFLGLDAAWTRLSMEYDMSGIYANQKNPVFNALLYEGRARFGKSLMLSRQDGTRRGVKAIKSGYPFFYLPDLDYGPRDALFVPFFGVPAATITGLSRLARLTGATVLPVIARMTESGYVVRIGAPWQDFPGESIEADTRRMNAFIEAEVLKMPEQYYWLHKRFKTRPPGEKRPY
ncbi:MAG: lysophospholipid acyltransferase family protein [Rhodocyclaceae bacterium]|jgi:KDO2-lipid IV(A) lauroyltransferase|nr:lysophospholipid acyltransferase family protein [Rhodocyclaceae bacterium]